MYFAIASRSAGLNVSPMPVIFPVSNAARMACQDIWRKVSGSGAPTALPGLWHCAQRD
jgi:hypothetical protein